MDYIREELLRQRQAWSALLRSGQQTETEERTQPAVGEAENPLWADAAEGGRFTASGGAETLPPAANGPGGRQRSAAARRRAAAGKTAAVPAGGSVSGNAAGLPVYPAMQALRPEMPGEQGVKELSRIIQRDSRRYDGGFTLY